MQCTSKGHASMTAPDQRHSHHKLFQVIKNSVVLRSYLKDISPTSLTTSPLSTLKNCKDTSPSQKMDIFNTQAYEWELDRMFDIWNSVVQDIINLIQEADNYKPIVILDKVHKAFFHCHDFLHWNYRSN